MGSFAQFGPMYRRIQACHVARGPNGHVEVLTKVRGADTDLPKCVPRWIGEQSLTSYALASRTTACILPFSMQPSMSLSTQS